MKGRGDRRGHGSVGDEMRLLTCCTDCKLDTKCCNEKKVQNFSSQTALHDPRFMWMLTFISIRSASDETTSIRNMSQTAIVLQIHTASQATQTSHQKYTTLTKHVKFT